MGELLGTIAGGTVAMLISGWLVAWLLRKVVSMKHGASCALGVTIMTFIGAWSITYEGSPTFLENWIVYVFCGAIVLPILIRSRSSVDGRAPSSAAETR